MRYRRYSARDGDKRESWKQKERKEMEKKEYIFPYQRRVEIARENKTASNANSSTPALPS